jgi:putative transposase
LIQASGLPEAGGDECDNQSAICILIISGFFPLQLQSVCGIIITMKYELDKGRHSVYSLYYHLVMCVKYRRKVLHGETADSLKQILKNLSNKIGITIIEIETGIDHVHILFKSSTTHQPSKVINSLKSVSARRLFAKHPEIKPFLWKRRFWSNSYFLATTGQVTID